ncbi:MAG TPA: Bax inhibitor-1 family protein, partial [Planctomycetaceae bacterium]
LIFVPLLLFASAVDASIIPTAGFLTLLIFGGLTVTVFVTGADFSFLRGFLVVASLLAIAAIVGSFFFGYGLGIWFSAAMIGLVSGFILYDTSNVLHHYRTDQYVAASLALFASVATLFWYVIRLLMSLSED